MDNAAYNARRAHSLSASRIAALLRAPSGVGNDGESGSDVVTISEHRIYQQQYQRNQHRAHIKGSLKAGEEERRKGSEM